MHVSCTSTFFSTFCTWHFTLQNLYIHIFSQSKGALTFRRSAPWYFQHIVWSRQKLENFSKYIRRYRSRKKIFLTMLLDLLLSTIFFHASKTFREAYSRACSFTCPRNRTHFADEIIRSVSGDWTQGERPPKRLDEVNFIIRWRLAQSPRIYLAPIEDMQYPKVEDCKTLIIQYNVDLLKLYEGTSNICLFTLLILISQEISSNIRSR